MAEKEPYDLRGVFETLTKYVKEIRYGSIVIVIQDGKIVQIEKNEKVRLI